MLKEKKPDNIASDIKQTLETENGESIAISSPVFLEWLETHNSFKFIAGAEGDNSYRARKEFLSGDHYWYAVKRVDGKLHKKFIGKSKDVTYQRLCEVAEIIKQPPTRGKKQSEVEIIPTEALTPPSPALAERMSELELIVRQLQIQLQELDSKKVMAYQSTLGCCLVGDGLRPTGGDRLTEESKHSESLGQLEQENQKLKSTLNELTNQLNNKDKQLSELRTEITVLKQELVQMNQGKLRSDQL